MSVYFTHMKLTEQLISLQLYLKIFLKISSLIHGMKLIHILMNMVSEMDLPLLNIEWNEIVKVKFIKEP